MMIEERMYIERMEGYEEGYKIGYAEGLEIEKKKDMLNTKKDSVN